MKGTWKWEKNEVHQASTWGWLQHTRNHVHQKLIFFFNSKNKHLYCLRNCPYIIHSMVKLHQICFSFCVAWESSSPGCACSFDLYWPLLRLFLSVSSESYFHWDISVSSFVCWSSLRALPPLGSDRLDTFLRLSSNNQTPLAYPSLSSRGAFTETQSDTPEWVSSKVQRKKKEISKRDNNHPFMTLTAVTSSHLLFLNTAVFQAFNVKNHALSNFSC